MKLSKLIFSYNLIILSLLMTGCFAVLKEKSGLSSNESTTPSDLFVLDAPVGVTKYTPLSERERKPRVSVSGALGGDTVSIFTDASCTQKIGETVASTDSRFASNENVTLIMQL